MQLLDGRHVLEYELGCGLGRLLWKVLVGRASKQGVPDLDFFSRQDWGRERALFQRQFVIVDQNPCVDACAKMYHLEQTARTMFEVLNWERGPITNSVHMHGNPNTIEFNSLH